LATLEQVIDGGQKIPVPIISCWQVILMDIFFRAKDLTEIAPFRMGFQVECTDPKIGVITEMLLLQGIHVLIFPSGYSRLG
jgi:hypothetical protein